MNIDDIKPDTFAATRSCVVDVVEIFTEHAPDAPPADHRLRREIGGAIEDAVDEGFVAGVMSVEIPPTLDEADMKWLIARTMSMWSEDYYAAAWLADLEGAITDAASGRVVARSDAAYEARRLVRLVETLGADWPTDVDLETLPESEVVS